MGAIFNDELKRLRGHFMEMGIDASEQIYQATKAFTENDPQLAKQVLAADTRSLRPAVILSGWATTPHTSPGPQLT